MPPLLIALGSVYLMDAWTQHSAELVNRTVTGYIKEC